MAAPPDRVNAENDGTTRFFRRGIGGYGALRAHAPGARRLRPGRAAHAPLRDPSVFSVALCDPSGFRVFAPWREISRRQPVAHARHSGGSRNPGGPMPGRDAGGSSPPREIGGSLARSPSGLGIAQAAKRPWRLCERHSRRCSPCPLCPPWWEAFPSRAARRREGPGRGGLNLRALQSGGERQRSPSPPSSPEQDRDDEGRWASVAVQLTDRMMPV